MSDDPYSATGVQLVTSLMALNKDMGNYVADVQKAINNTLKGITLKDLV